MIDRHHPHLRTLTRYALAVAIARSVAACSSVELPSAPVTSASLTQAGGEHWYSGPPSGASTIAVEGTAPSEPFYSGAPEDPNAAAQTSESETSRGGRGRGEAHRGRSSRRTRAAADDASEDEPQRRRSTAQAAVVGASSAEESERHAGLQFGFGIPVPLGEPFGVDPSNGDGLSPPVMLRAEYGAGHLRGGVILFPSVLDKVTFGAFIGAPFTRFRMGPVHASVGYHVDLLMLPTGGSSYEVIFGSLFMVDFRVRYPFLRWLSASAQVDGGAGLLVHSGERSKHFGAGLLFTFGFGLEASF